MTRWQAAVAYTASLSSFVGEVVSSEGKMPEATGFVAPSGLAG